MFKIHQRTSIFNMFEKHKNLMTIFTSIEKENTLEYIHKFHCIHHLFKNYSILLSK